MKRSCPSCGSPIDDNDDVCANCGEPVPTGSDAGVPRTSSPAAISETPRATRAAAVTPSSGGAVGSETGGRTGGGTVICAECGTANPAGAAECVNCGSELRPAAMTREAARPAPEPKKRSAARDYLLAAIGTIVVAMIVFFLARPEEKTGPAEPTGNDPHAAGGGALPPGHPPTDPQALTAAQEEKIAELRRAVEADPKNIDANLQLANALYDAGKHTEAVPYYRTYIAAKPEDANARTDMAYSIYESGKTEEAITELRRVLAKDPNHQFAAYNMAMMYVAKRERDSVLLWLQKVVQIDSSTVQAQRAVQLIGALQQAHAPGQ